MPIRTACLAAVAGLFLTVAPQVWAQAPSLKVSSENPHQLVTGNGDPYFMNADTAWSIGTNPTNSEVDDYLDTRRSQKYNAIQMIASPFGHDTTVQSAPPPFKKVNGQWDLTQPIVNPDHPDYWDHIGDVIDKANNRGMEVLLLPTWGSYVAGSWDGSDTSDVVIDNQQEAYTYGHFIGDRFSDKKNVMWVLGGDRSAEYGSGKDYRPIWDAMAEGVTDGVNGVDNQDGQANYSSTLMTYHPRKPDGSSATWFHNRDWLDVNANQSWPRNPRTDLQNAYGKNPPQPVWLSEGRYEDYNSHFKGWTTRVQAYTTVFSGAFGHTYGNHHILDFDSGWEDHLNDPGAQDMTHLYELMTGVLTKEAYLHRVPDQSLLNGVTGDTSTSGGYSSVQMHSNAKSALRGESGDFALVYTANGEDIELDLSQLQDGEMDGYWFNPRSGKWLADGQEHEDLIAFDQFDTGSGAAVKTFTAPGSPAQGNDWVLLLAAPSAVPEPSTALLLGLGGVMLIPRRNRRNSKA